MKWLHRLFNPSDYIHVDTLKNYLKIVEEEANHGMLKEGAFNKMGYFYDGWITLASHMRHDISHGGLTTRLPKPKE